MKKKSIQSEQITIAAPRIHTITFEIVGTAPYVQLAFSEKARLEMEQKMTTPQEVGKKKKRDPKDFDQLFRDAQHLSEDGWNGIPASAFRKAMIDACRLTNQTMTMAKMCCFIVGDGIDRSEGIPLVKIIGKSQPLKLHVRNATGVCDVRMRARFFPWSATISIRHDADAMDKNSVANLLMRAGAQIGIGEGRPFSKDSCGLGWGTFEIKG